MIPHLSPSMHFDFTSYILHLAHVLSVSLSFPLLGLPSVSPQIIANHHMQSISFASGGDPVSHPSLFFSSNLTLAFFHLSSSFFMHAFPSCLKSLSIMNTTYLTATSLLAVCSRYLSFSSVYMFNLNNTAFP